LKKEKGMNWKREKEIPGKYFGNFSAGPPNVLADCALFGFVTSQKSAMKR